MEICTLCSPWSHISFGTGVWDTVLKAGRSRVRFPRGHWSFHRHNLSGRALALGSTLPLTELCTRIIMWVVNATGG